MESINSGGMFQYERDVSKAAAVVRKGYDRLLKLAAV